MNQLKVVLFLAICGLYAVAAEKCSEEGFHVFEEDCGRFYRCVSGERFDFDCNEGLKFHKTLNVCVNGSELDCVALPKPVTEISPTAPPKEPSPPTADCPKGDGHFVDEKDCNRFYVCNDGARHYNNCGSGLHFDTVSQTCTEAGKAKCTNE